MPNGRESEAGFSLVEILVALTILAMVLAPLLGSFSQSARLETAAAERNHWADEARSVLDLATTLPREGVQTGALSDGTPYVLTTAIAASDERLRRVPVELYRVEMRIGQEGSPAAIYTALGLRGGAP